MTAKDHNRTLGILFLVYAGLQMFGLVIAGVVMLVVSSSMMADLQRNADMPAGFLVTIIFVAVVFSFVLLIPELVAGLKLLKAKPNGRIWGIVASVIAVVNIPIGTALGIYGLWFLLGDQGKQLYAAGTPQGGFQAPPQPPPPNSWQ
jgi:hypothetical protein